MITTDDVLNMNFYKKEKFTGSYKGMRYLIKKDSVVVKVNDDGTEEKEDILRCYLWPGPYNFETTADEEKQMTTYPFSAEGKQQAVDWLNEQWALRKNWTLPY